jgi:predicted metallo-beta-lactamase superfamily hydrolase
MKTITTLRDDLYLVLDQLRAGTIEVKTAAEMNNTAGKIINTLRAELEYASQRKVPPEIAFLNTEEAP